MEVENYIKELLKREERKGIFEERKRLKVKMMIINYLSL